MFRIFSLSAKRIAFATLNKTNLVSQNAPKLFCLAHRNFSSLLAPNQVIQSRLTTSILPNEISLTNNTKSLNYAQSRTVTKYSMRKGKRKTVKTVLKRFYRLNWGIWIRTYCGRHKKLWKKSPPRKRRLRQHVFCNATQSTLLDKMVNAYWRKPKYYVEDPYEPYHTREEFQFTYKKPRPYFPPEHQ